MVIYNFIYFKQIFKSVLKFFYLENIIFYVIYFYLSDFPSMIEYNHMFIIDIPSVSKQS